jgi:hypothetical protein
MGGALRPSLLPRLAGQSSPKIIAYHGSPHSFDRFDASKIGTGEGQQAFGHGLYFAGAEDTARTYRNILSGRRDVLIDGRSVSDALKDFEGGGQLGWSSTEAPVRSPQANALRALMAGAYDADSVDAVLANARRYAADAPAARAAQDLMALQELASRDIRLGSQPGHMYEVEIDAPEGQLLDLDLPVQSQPQVVQDALGKYVEAPSWFSLGQEGWVGKNAYMRMAGDMAAANPRIAGGYHVVHDQPAASASLLQGGVPGIRYLDQGSRSAGEGTRNFVMFPGTEDRIRILRKYGLLAPMALPAMSEE